MDLDMRGSWGGNRARTPPPGKSQSNPASTRCSAIIEPFQPRHDISSNVVCATSEASDQPAHMRSLIRAFASRLDILWVLSYWLNIILKGGCTGSSESWLVKMAHCCKLYVAALLIGVSRTGQWWRTCSCIQGFLGYRPLDKQLDPLC